MGANGTPAQNAAARLLLNANGPPVSYRLTLSVRYTYKMYQSRLLRRRSASSTEMLPVRSSSRITRRSTSRSSRERGLEGAALLELAEGALSAVFSSNGTSASSYSIGTRCALGLCLPLEDWDSSLRFFHSWRIVASVSSSSDITFSTTFWTSCSTASQSVSRTCLVARCA